MLRVFLPVSLGIVWYGTGSKLFKKKVRAAIKVLARAIDLIGGGGRKDSIGLYFFASVPVSKTRFLQRRYK